MDGPLAGEGIWAQMFAGLTPDELSPLGLPAEHSFLPGTVYGGILTVPGSDPFGTVYVQMYAWDGQMWGIKFGDVPAEWLGYTDVVSRDLAIGGVGPPFGPPAFTQQAVVPVPEPSSMALALLGVLRVLALQRRGVITH